mmetsp:Transcript_128788/g.358566  ORF Transcript_128788/g.358566 Transcript_128788/m.358566 type:complete len:213 (-) Transcript_128788:22-660(-)
MARAQETCAAAFAMLPSPCCAHPATVEAAPASQSSGPLAKPCATDLSSCASLLPPWADAGTGAAASWRPAPLGGGIGAAAFEGRRASAFGPRLALPCSLRRLLCADGGGLAAADVRSCRGRPNGTPHHASTQRASPTHSGRNTTKARAPRLPMRRPRRHGLPPTAKAAAMGPGTAARGGPGPWAAEERVAAEPPIAADGVTRGPAPRAGRAA